MNEWMTLKSLSYQADSDVSFPWLTVEFTLWVLLFIVALGLRLLQLDNAPLNASEARDALTALGFANGQDFPAPNGYSPLLVSGQWLLFLVTGANELTARLLPVLAGTALVLTPALLRPQLGGLGALGAGTLLALSPTALTLSRRASGDILVALGAMLGFCGLWRYLTHRVPEQPTPKTLPSRFLQLSALGIALVLVSGPLAYSVLLSMALAFVVAALVDRGCRDLFCRGWLTLRATPKLTTYTLGVFAGAVVLLSTAFAWHFEGLAATAGLVTQWLDGFVRWPDSLRPDYPILILMFYEPLILLTGGVGVALATARGSPFSRVMTLWSIAALILALIRPGRSPGDVLIILLPLACLGGVALEALFGGLRRRGHWLNEGLYLVVTLPLWAYLLINVATYSSRSAQYSHIDLPLINFSVPTFLGLAVVAAFLLFFLAVGIASMQGLGPALRGLGLSAIIAALCATIAAGWGVSQNRSTDPRELLVLEPTATDMQLLKDSLSRVSRTHSGDAHAIDLTVLTDDPALNWVLRDFRQTQVFEPSEVPAATSAVIAPQVLGVPPLAGDYLGQSFALRRRWEGDSLACRRNTIQIGFDQVPQLDCSALADWILFRRSPEQPTEEQVVLWLRQDLVGW